MNTDTGWADLYLDEDGKELAKFFTVEGAQIEIKEIAAHGDYLVDNFRVVDIVFEAVQSV